MEKRPKKIDHIGIAVSSIEEALPFYTETLKLPLLAIEELEGIVKIAFLEIGESKIELLEPISQDNVIAEFIAEHGEGIHHVALGVEGIQERINEIKEKGVVMIDDTPYTGAGGSQIAFINPTSTRGVLYEFCEKK